MKDKKRKLYIVRKFVVASSAKEAIEKEKRHPVHDVFMEETAMRESINETVENIKTPTKKAPLGFG